MAQNRARANLDALREYSGVSPQPNPQRGEPQRPQGAADVQSLTPQIDRTFIDRILEMSAPNTIFLQELTRAMVKASLEALEVLKGDRAGTFSVRVNERYRITFRFEGGHADDVTCEDFH